MSGAVPAWTAYFKALHSALIDEVIERHPEPKPTLGLPRRSTGIVDSPTGGTREIWTTLQAPGGRAVLALAYEAAIEPFLKPPGMAPLWKAWLERARRELVIRKLEPLADAPEGTARPSFAVGTFVWIPFELSGGVLYMGFGVEA